MALVLRPIYFSKMIVYKLAEGAHIAKVNSPTLFLMTPASGMFAKG
jgi:hypothetical protein